MAKKPVNFTVRNAKEAASRLNDFVEQGGFSFDIGVNKEYVTTVSVNPNKVGVVTNDYFEFHAVNIGKVDLIKGENTIVLTV